MRGFLTTGFVTTLLGIVLAGSALAPAADGQAVPAQNLTAPPDGYVHSGAPTKAVGDNENDNVDANSDSSLDPASLLPDLPPLPHAKASLLGGTVNKLDRVRDLITMQIFGGGKIKIAFDTRTLFYRDGAQASVSDLRQGDRVSVDTILDGTAVFAKTIRLHTAVLAGESEGILLSYRAEKSEIVMRDMLSPRPLKILITPETQVLEGGHSSSPRRFEPGTLIAVKFGPQRNGSDVAREISLLAVPGSSFTFAGQVTSLDFRLGLLVLTSLTDGKTYEIHFDPSVVAVDNDLRPGSEVTAVARFEDSRYVARSLTINSR